MSRKLFRTALAVCAIRSMFDYGSGYAQQPQGKYRGVDPSMEPIVSEVIRNGSLRNNFTMSNGDTLKNAIIREMWVEPDDSTSKVMLLIIVPKKGGYFDLITSMPLIEDPIYEPPDSGMIKLTDFTVFERGSDSTPIDLEPDEITKETGVVESNCTCVPYGVMMPEDMNPQEAAGVDSTYTWLIGKLSDALRKRGKDLSETEMKKI
jgi:hypothetical protein